MILIPAPTDDDILADTAPEVGEVELSVIAECEVIDARVARHEAWERRNGLSKFLGDNR